MNCKIQFGKCENWKSYKYFLDIRNDGKFSRFRFQNTNEVDIFLQRLVTAVNTQKLQEKKGEK